MSTQKTDATRDTLVATLATTDAPGRIFRLQPPAPIAAAPSPHQGVAALQWNPVLPVLYGVTLQPEGRLLAWTWKDRALCLTADVPSYGSAPCHLAVDPTGHFLVVANYSTGSLTVFRLDDSGLPGNLSSLHRLSGNSRHPSRQASPHPHQVVFITDTTFLVNDLGSDAVVGFTLNPSTGALTQRTNSPMPRGTGPRHLAILPDDRLAISGELNGTVVLARLDRATATVTPIATAPTSGRHARYADKPNFPGDIATVAETIYVTNRGFGTIALLRCDRDRLVLINEFDSGGRTPQHLFVSPDIVLAACRDADQVTVWRRNVSGRLRQVATIAIPQPAWLIRINSRVS